jgi:hypothetical protein
MLGRTRALVLQACKTIALKRLQNRIDVGTRQLEAVRDTLFVPPFDRHPDHGPARLVRIGKGGKSREAELELDRRVVGG